MDRSKELALGDRLKTMIEAGPAPAEHPFARVDPTVYSSVQVHRSEVASMAAGPVAAVASSELAVPGDFATMELVGVPVIVTRDRDGQVRAMRNVCAHRGATVETRESGSARIFSCGFHAWSYELDGSLRAVSDAGLWSNESCDTGLQSLACEERHGIIWVTPDAAAAPQPVVDWLGGAIDGLLHEFGVGAMVHHAAADHEVHCNWKLLTDGFLELYHLKYLHRNSIAPYFPANTNDPGRSDGHFITWIPKNRLVKVLTEQPREEWEVLAHLTGTIVLVPGTVVQWQAGHVEVFSLRPHPTDPTRSVARLTMLVPAERAGESELWDRNWERPTATVPSEDFAAAENVQANIDAGVVDEIRIGANERMLVEHLEAVQNRSNIHDTHRAGEFAHG